MVYLNKCN